MLRCTCYDILVFDKFHLGVTQHTEVLTLGRRNQHCSGDIFTILFTPNQFKMKLLSYAGPVGAVELSLVQPTHL